MGKRFFIGDTHFGHRNIITFKGDDGQLIRPFPDVESMNEHMIECWNSVVGEHDRVVVLGDLVINRRWIAPIMPRLKGKKWLVGGNHDIFKLRDYLPYFEEIRGVYLRPIKELNRWVCFTHVPVHPHSKGRWLANVHGQLMANVHGHLHTNVVMDPVTGEPDPWYFCASAEQLAYTPIEWDDLVDILKSRGLGKDGSEDQTRARGSEESSILPDCGSR